MSSDAPTRRTPRASLAGGTLRTLRANLKALGAKEREAHVDPAAPEFSLYYRTVQWGGRQVSGAEFVLDFVRASNSTRSGGGRSR